MDRYLSIVRERLEKAKGKDRLIHQWRFLENIGLDEFYGCDLKINPFLDQIPSDSDIIDIRSFLQHSLVEALLEQLESGTSTVLLNVEKMKRTPAEVLIPRILELRKNEIATTSVRVEGMILQYYDVFMKEIDREVFPSKGQSVILEDLWLTALGYQVLRESGIGFRTDITGLKKIEKALKKLDVTIKVENGNNNRTKQPARISDDLRDLVLSHAIRTDSS